MRKITLLVFAVLTVGFLSAQNLSILHEGTDVSGTTINITGSEAEEIVYEFDVKNGDADFSAKLDLGFTTVVSDVEVSYCIPMYCIPVSDFSNTATSPSFNLQGSDHETSGFSFHYHAHNNPGTSTFTIRIYDPANTSNSAEITLSITAGEASIFDNSGVEIVSDIYPNPASEFAKINYNIPSNSTLDVEVYDLLGKKVRSYQLVSNGVLNMPLTGLEKGTYFCRFLLDGEIDQTEKLIIK